MSTSKPDLSEFYKLSRPDKPPCKVGAALDQLEDLTDRENCEAALDAGKDVITASAITKWFETRDITFVTFPAVASHRAKTCTCFPEESK